MSNLQQTTVYPRIKIKGKVNNVGNHCKIC